MNVFIVFIFGFFGGLSRYGLSNLIKAPSGFPISTIIINLIGCFLFAFLVKNFLLAKNVHEKLILGIGTGFLGGFTTFSSCMVDFSKLILAGDIIGAGIYFVLSAIGGLLMCMLGMKIGARFQKGGEAK
jgi:CrcB protein